MGTAKFASVLWDVPQSAKVDEKFVIKRALLYGGVFMIQDLIKTAGIRAVRSVFYAMKPTEMSVKRYYFLKVFFLK